MLLGRIMVDHNAFSLVVWVELLVGNCSHDLYKVGRYTSERVFSQVLETFQVSGFGPCNYFLLCIMHYCKFPTTWFNCIFYWSSLSGGGLWSAPASGRKEYILHRHDLPFFPFFSLLLFCLWAIVVSQPSICHLQPVSPPSKGSDFKMECFSSASLATQLCRLSLCLGKKMVSPHQRREIGAWKEMHKPTYAQ